MWLPFFEKLLTLCVCVLAFTSWGQDGCQQLLGLHVSRLLWRKGEAGTASFPSHFNFTKLYHISLLSNCTKWYHMPTSTLLQEKAMTGFIPSGLASGNADGIDATQKTQTSVGPTVSTVGWEGG